MSRNNTKDKKTVPMADYINRYWMLSDLRHDFLMLILGSVTAIVVNCFDIEYSSGIDSLWIPRYFSVGDTGSGIKNAIRSIVYHFGDESVVFGGRLMNILNIFFILFVIKFIISVFTSAHAIQKLHQNKKDIAAELESRLNSRMNFSQLRSAIDSADPLSAQHIDTGADDPDGIETAVNSLMDRMKDIYIHQTQFVNDASHELRTPISVIQGYVNMLDRWGKTDEKILDESIAALKKESGNMATLVEQLLFLARGDSGRQPISKDVFSLSDLVKEVYEEYQLIDKTHRYICDIQNECSVYADASMIKQTMRILTDNARKYTPEGGAVTLRAKRTNRGEASFEIEDTGIGIDHEDLQHIFERFYRADKARNRDIGGTGLGLSIAKWIVDKMDGRFEIDSVVEIGTKFAVIFPKYTPEDADFLLDESKDKASSILFRHKKS